MIDIKLIRAEPEVVKAGLARRGEDSSAIDTVLELDAKLRAIGTQRDDIRAEVNTLSKQVGLLHRDGKKDEAQEVQAKSKALGEQEKALSGDADELSA